MPKKAFPTRQDMDSHLATYPLPDMSWMKIFESKTTLALYRAWSNSHPLFGQKIPLRSPMAHYVSKARRQVISHLTAQGMERFENSWRIAAYKGSSFWWVYPDDIAWDNIAKGGHNAA